MNPDILEAYTDHQSLETAPSLVQQQANAMEAGVDQELNAAGESEVSIQAGSLVGREEPIRLGRARFRKNVDWSESAVLACQMVDLEAQRRKTLNIVRTMTIKDHNVRDEEAFQKVTKNRVGSWDEEKCDAMRSLPESAYASSCSDCSEDIGAIALCL